MIKDFFVAVLQAIGGFFGLIKRAVLAVCTFVAGLIKKLFVSGIIPLTKFLCKTIIYIPIKFFCKFVIYIPIKFVCKYVIYIPIKFVCKFVIYIPLRFIVWLIYKLYYYLVFMPLRFVAIALFKYVIMPVCRAIKFVVLKLCEGIGFLYERVLLPSFGFVFRLIKSFFKGLYSITAFAIKKLAWAIKTAIVFVAKWFYKLLLYPIFYVLRLICKGIWLGFVYLFKFIRFVFVCLFKFIRFVFTHIGKFFYRFMLCPLYKLSKLIAKGVKLALFYIGKFFYNFLLYPIYWLVVHFFKGLWFVVRHIAKFVYRFLIYPIAFALYKFFCLIEFLARKLAQFLKFIVVKVASFIYDYILVPICRFLKLVILSIIKGVRFAVLWVARAIKFVAIKTARFVWAALKALYQAVMVIIFLPIIIVFFLVLTFFTAPYSIFKKELPSLAVDIENQKSRKVMLNPFYLIVSFAKNGSAHIKATTQEKQESLGVLKTKHCCSLVTFTIWTLILYPVSFFLLLLS